MFLIKEKQVNEIEKYYVAQFENTPNIVITDKLTLFNLGKWLRLLAASKLYGDIYIDDELTKEEEINYKYISTERKKYITKTLSSLLENIGINKYEICTLSLIDCDNLVFNLHLDKSNTDLKITLKYCDIMHNHGDEFIISSKNEQKVFDFCKKTKTLKLQELTLKNQNNNSTYWKMNSEYGFSATVLNNDYMIKIYIKYPNFLKDETNNPYINEIKIQKALLNLDFPFDISNIYNEIEKSLLMDISKYSNFEIEINKLRPIEREELTDCIKLKNGNIVNFVTTRNGKIIILKEPQKINEIFNNDPCEIYDQKDFYIKKNYSNIYNMSSSDIFEYSLEIKDRNLYYYVNPIITGNEIEEKEKTNQLIKSILKK